MSGDTSPRRSAISGGGSAPLRDDAVFLVASLTKPVVAMAVLMLVERGQLALTDRVVDFIPEFNAPAKRNVTIRNLLTHSSGLPDMLPNNRSLRRSQSRLASFCEGTCAVTLDFPPGHGVQYQSMGFVLLAEIIGRVSGHNCSEFITRELLEPLGMKDSLLGTPDHWYDSEPELTQRVAEIRVPPEQQEGSDWNWNSRYWQQLGAPWGGLLSTPADLASFCGMMLNGGRCDEQPLFSPQTVRAALSNQLDTMPNVPEADRRTRPWGFGWRRNWPAHGTSFGDLLSPQACGHWGATGTLFWIDPPRQAACIILSTQPLDPGRNHLIRLSNAIAAAFD